MAAYYNEIDPYAAQWLRNLIAAGHIAPGDVDERDIRDVPPSDLAGYTQCHFFAGIGLWSAALRGAGWPDDREVWTGSCPCQPFSAAGRRTGLADERHLWPHFHYLIEQRRPRHVFGEQVANGDGLAWFDLVRADLEGSSYAAAVLDLCAAGFGAPHWRQRLYWAADTEESGRRPGRASEAFSGPRKPSRLREARRLADIESDGRRGRAYSEDGGRRQLASGHHGALSELGDSSSSAGSSLREFAAVLGTRWTEARRAVEQSGRASPLAGHWADADWIECLDGKWRPVEPGSFPLDHGHPNRVGKLRAYGNGIVTEQAQEFIAAYMAFDDFRRGLVLVDDGDLF